MLILSSLSWGAAEASSPSPQTEAPEQVTEALSEQIGLRAGLAMVGWTRVEWSPLSAERIPNTPWVALQLQGRFEQGPRFLNLSGGVQF